MANDIVVYIRADRFSMQLNLPTALEELPQGKLVKIFNLLFTHAYEEECNRDTIRRLNDYLPGLVTAKKTAWHDASVRYSNEYRGVSRYTKTIIAKGIRANNKRLLEEVAKTKHAYEKALRTHERYKEVRKKYTF